MFVKQIAASGWCTTTTHSRPAVNSTFAPFSGGDFKDGFTEFSFSV